MARTFFHPKRSTARRHRRTTTVVARDPGLRAAIDAAGGVRALARLLNITPSAVAGWVSVPYERLLEVERVTGVCRERLRPELYRIPR